jgi:anti-sigma B factor antagonist
MQITVRTAQDVVILDLEGKLTAGLGDLALRQKIDELLAAQHKQIILNLSGVTFLDSAGVGELVASQRSVTAEGARLKLINPSERAHSTLYIARLLPAFEVHRDEAEALAHFKRDTARPRRS